jgi:diguanylate cyclase (GGDEF)-like protein
MFKRVKSDIALYGAPAPAHLLMLVGVAGVVCPVLTFLLAASNIVYSIKALLLMAAVATFLVFYTQLRTVLRLAGENESGTDASDNSSGISDAIQEQLTALDDANQFFGSSLSSADMFRLVSSRVGDICPCDATALYLLNGAGTRLKVTFTDGKNAGFFQGIEIDAEDGLAGMAATSGDVEMDMDLMLENFALPANALQGFQSAVAIPLFYEDKVFGVYQLYSSSALNDLKISSNVYEAIGHRVGRLFQSSMAFEQSISSALTDVLTGLPNQRAFFMILENQLAESMRYRNERPLTVLSIDIKGFAEINSDLGHAVGDRMLEFCRDRIKEQLRKMDFLARTMNDEFAVILPTASEKTAAEIMERIKGAFANTPFAISEEESLKIRLNFGWATFWKDGETANQLIGNAHLRKQQEKSHEPAGVLWFPREYVN